MISVREFDKITLTCGLAANVVITRLANHGEGELADVGGRSWHS